MPTKPANASDRQPAADFQQVSRRIVRWTTNGLATAIVLVAGLAFGRQIMLWWHEGSAGVDVASHPPLSSLAGGMGSRELEFGSSTAHLTTETVQGERSVAIGALRRLVERKGASGTAPVAPAGPAEARLMALIAKKITGADRNTLRLDEIDSRLPTVVASRGFDNNKQTNRRIVAVGFALPADAGWTLYAFQFSGTAARGSRADETPLPPGSRRSISLRQPDGGVLTAFHGDASALEWEQFFGAELPKRGWQLVADWKSAAGRCSARYSKSEPNVLSGRGASWLDVQFGPDDRGQLCGTLTIMPGDSQQRTTSQTNSADP